MLVVGDGCVVLGLLVIVFSVCLKFVIRWLKGLSWCMDMGVFRGKGCVIVSIGWY